MHITLGEETIKATPEHSFYVDGEGWVKAKSLTLGDKIRLYSGENKEITSIKKEELENKIKVYNFEVEDFHTYFVSEENILVHNDCSDVGSFPITNWKGQEVKIPDGHKISPRDPNFSEPPIYREGPYTTEQRDSFLPRNSAETKLAPHHRYQIPVRDGGVIDELPSPGHPEGNIHTGGSPSRHPAKSIFNSETNCNKLRQSEIIDSWKVKGQRLIEIEDGVWIDKGFK
ncbi:polymorphic toxin-type HINT domain-containing protein [Clostridium sp. Marseille-Q7071]